MSQENIEIVREGYEHFNRGDIDWMVERMTPDISWTDSTVIPGAKTHRGTDEVRTYLESFDRIWEEARFEPEEFREHADKVLVLARFVARGRQSGADVDAALAHLYEMRDGKGASVVTYFDREQAERDFLA
jgi:ketosteroid isomerase-like protein